MLLSYRCSQILTSGSAYLVAVFLSRLYVLAIQAPPPPPLYPDTQNACANRGYYHSGSCIQSPYLPNCYANQVAARR